MSVGQEKKIIINKEFNPIILGEIISRHWYLPLIYMCIFGSIAFLYLRYTKPIYQSSAVLQLVEEDQVKQALGEGALSVQAKGSDLNKTIEFLRSEYLFEKAISKINTSVGVFSEGKLLTKDLYKSTGFKIVPIQIKDSSVCGLRIDVKYANNIIELHYNKNGKAKVIRGVLNGKFKN
jgi:uncharacterized protein involved in exopolysaccharide biosynthesis